MLNISQMNQDHILFEYLIDNTFINQHGMKIIKYICYMIIIYFQKLLNKNSNTSIYYKFIVYKSINI